MWCLLFLSWRQPTKGSVILFILTYSILTVYFYVGIRVESRLLFEWSEQFNQGWEIPFSLKLKSNSEQIDQIALNKRAIVSD